MSWAGRLNLLALWLRGRVLRAADYGAAYDAVAPTYPEWERLMAPHTARLADPALLPPGAEVLDLACGAGAVSQRLLAGGAGLRLTGVDVSAAMLDLYRHRCPGHTAVQAEALGFLAAAPARWDAVLCAWGMVYLPRRRFLAAAARALRPGGVLGVIVNRAGTLPGLREAVLAVMARRPRAVRRLMCVGGRLPHDAGGLADWGRRAGLVPLRAGDGEERVPCADAAAAWEWLRRSGAGAGIADCFADPAAVHADLLAAYAPHLAASGGAVVHRFAWALWRKEPSGCGRHEPPGVSACT